jgi:hypothetical protein
MLKYKDFVMPTIGLFFRHKNEVDVFVEDNYDEEFYLTLITRIFQQTGHKVNKLLPLGCKRNVIDACKVDQEKRASKRIYVVDGDLDLITDTNEKGLNYLYILDKYCVENYLLHEDSIVEIVHDFLVVKKSTIKKKLDFENWLKGLSFLLIDLFLHYAISKEVCPSVPTISLGVGNLCAPVKGVPALNAQKCNQRIMDLQTEILKVITEEVYNEKIYALRNKWLSNVDTLLKIVSGKDYIIPLLEFRFQRLKSINTIHMRRNSLRLRLAKLCDISGLLNMSKVI